jgi:hypothetical protein
VTLNVVTMLVAVRCNKTDKINDRNVRLWCGKVNPELPSAG